MEVLKGWNVWMKNLVEDEADLIGNLIQEAIDKSPEEMLQEVYYDKVRHDVIWDDVVIDYVDSIDWYHAIKADKEKVDMLLGRPHDSFEMALADMKLIYDIADERCHYCADDPDDFVRDIDWTPGTQRFINLTLSASEVLGLPASEIYGYCHGGCSYNTVGFLCPWDSGLVGVAIADSPDADIKDLEKFLESISDC